MGDLAEMQAAMRARMKGGLSHASKCEHGVYWPSGDPVALYCSYCGSGPQATPETVQPKTRKPRKKRVPIPETPGSLSESSSTPCTENVQAEISH